MQDDVAASERRDADFVEVATAIDSGEASIWVRQLGEQGIAATTEKKGSLLRTILYVGRRPVAVKVARNDYAAALEYLKRLHFIR